MRKARWAELALLALLAGFAGIAAVAQPDSTEIGWDRMFRLPEGRVFVTDGAITLDAELAKLPALPSTELPTATGEVMQRYMAAELPDEFDLDDLERGSMPQTYQAPSGVTLAAKYVELLRKIAPDASLRMKGTLEPVVIVSDGRVVGLVMAIASPAAR